MFFISCVLDIFCGVYEPASFGVSVALYVLVLAMRRINLIIYCVCVKLNFTKLQKETPLKRFQFSTFLTKKKNDSFDGNC